MLLFTDCSLTGDVRARVRDRNYRVNDQGESKPGHHRAQHLFLSLGTYTIDGILTNNADN